MAICDEVLWGLGPSGGVPSGVSSAYPLATTGNIGSMTGTREKMHQGTSSKPLILQEDARDLNQLSSSPVLGPLQY
jgi:hypothetical protein